jgi:TRAP-type mannitol/chloroaromatic compound transport system permease small subunit
MIGVLMVMICADVAVRNITGGSLPMIAEAGAITLVTMVYLQLATTIRHDRLARADLFFAGFRRRFPRGGAVLAAVYDLTAAGELGVIAWSTITILERNITRGEYIGVTGIATLPTWPFRAAILLGLTVATIQCLVHAGLAVPRPGEGGGDVTGLEIGIAAVVLLIVLIFLGMPIGIGMLDGQLRRRRADPQRGRGDPHGGLRRQRRAAILPFRGGAAFRADGPYW